MSNNIYLIDGKEVDADLLRSEVAQLQLQKPAIFSFANSDGETVGELHETKKGELVFKGSVSESASIFFKAIIQENNQWVKVSKEGLQQIIDHSKDSEAKRIAHNLLSGDF